MQNEPNFPDEQMNVNKVLTRDYEKKSNWTLGENEPKTNPIKANFQKAQINVNKVLTKDYENKSNWALFENKPNSNPIYRGVAFGEDGTKPTCRGEASGEAGTCRVVASGEDGTCRGVAAGEDGSEAKKCCSPPLCCGISKEKMIFCNLINRKYQFNIIAVRMSNNKTI